MEQQQDFMLLDRKSQKSSIKYWMATNNKSNVNEQKMIVCGMADMQFKFPNELFNSFKKSLQKPKGLPHFGYVMIPPSVKITIKQWMINQYQIQVHQNQISDWPNMFCLYYATLRLLTQQNDNILFITPSYYRLILTAHKFNRCSIESKMQIKQNRFYMNYNDIEQKLQNNNIKLLVLVNPMNPTGRIWTYKQLQQLVLILQKYPQIYIYSDEIYSFAVEIGFISMMKFKSLEKRIIVGISHTKAFNCSGMGLAYSFIRNQEIKIKIDSYKYFTGSSPTLASYRLTEICLKQGKHWRNKCIKYIKQNYNLFKQQCSIKLPKLQIYTLQSTYLILVDFKQYQINGSKLKNRIHSQQIYPAYIDDWYVQWYKNKQQKTFVRINIACHRSLVQQIINRLVNQFGSSQ